MNEMDKTEKAIVYFAFGKNILADMRALRGPEDPLPGENVKQGYLIGGSHLTDAAHYFGIARLGRPLYPTDVAVIFATNEPNFHFEFYTCSALGPEEKPWFRSLTDESLEYLLTATRYEKRIIRDRIFVMEESFIELFRSLLAEKGYNIFTFTEPEEQSKEPKQLEQVVKDVQ